MANHLRQTTNRRSDRWLVGLIVALVIVIIVTLTIFFTSRQSNNGQAVVHHNPSVVSSAEAQATPTPSKATPAPLAAVTPSPVVIKKPALPDLKGEASSSDTRLVIPSIGFNEPLEPTAIQYDQAGNPVLSNDVKVHLATNLSPKNCDVTGGDYIMGHSTVYTEVWGFTPFNLFKMLTPSNVGQVFSIGAHRYEIVTVIIQPKDALKTTEEFWCQPPGNVSIVTCYTQEEDGDNVIIIGRPV